MNLCISVVPGKSHDVEKSSAEKFWIAHVVQVFVLLHLKQNAG